jgi:DNA mismatch repair protein MutS
VQVLPESLSAENVTLQMNNIMSDQPITPPTERKIVGVVEHYRTIQKEYPSHIILFQLGDFFEVFDETARLVSHVLDIGLCESRHGTSMTGFPSKTMDNYLERLIKAGHSVVIVEQYDNAGGIARKVTRVITPGTLTEENMLESGSNNFMMAIEQCSGGDDYGLAWIDLSTGFFRLSEVSVDELYDELVRISPIEIIADPALKDLEDLQKYFFNNRTTFTSAGPFNESSIYRDLFGAQFILKEFTSAELSAGSKLLNYVLKTQLERRPYIEEPLRHSRMASMQMDAAALKALEILKNNTTNSRENSLLDVLDETCTAVGSRLFVQRLQTPLTDVAQIISRLDQQTFFVERYPLVEQICEQMKECKDLERCFQRLALNRSTGGPRDMQVMQQTLKQADRVKQILTKIGHDVTNSFCERIDSCNELMEELKQALQDNLPSRASDGGLIRSGYSTTLDSLRGDAESLGTKSEQLLEQYRSITKRKGLSIVNYKRMGFLLEVNKSEGELSGSAFILNSQVGQKYRYRTAELDLLDQAICNSGEEVLREELRIYEILRQKIVKNGRQIMATAKTIAELDVVVALAKVAKKRGFCRPIISDSMDFAIVNGRHPVVEYKHADTGRTFVQNSCELGVERRFAFITGPNMGGKSTFLRQNALIAVMAQCGMYVPAESARIGIVDAVYTRIGASDDLSRDRSTFMVEMIETAVILKNATAKSLVIMDEVGRGTAATEGYALAHGICKYLYSVGCRSMFATHYWDLGRLIKSFESSQCLMTAARMDGGRFYFLHQIYPGISQKSHAIDIARLAGVPEAVLWDAEGIMMAPKIDLAGKIRSIISEESSSSIEGCERLEKIKELLSSSSSTAVEG